MNNEKFRKSLDEIKPSQALINKTLMNIKEKKKINYFMPFYMASLVAVCSIILITTYIINDNSTTTNSINNHFLIEIKGEYTFEHIFDFNILPEEDLKNMYVLKYGETVEQDDYNIPYNHYKKFMDIIQPLKENKINTLNEFKEEKYNRIVINDEKYFYVPDQQEVNELVFYDKTNQVYYQIEITREQEKVIGELQLYIIWFSKMNNKENFIEQSSIKNRKQTTYMGMYLVEKTNKNGEWESYMKSRDYSDYQELMTYLERFRHNKVNKYMDEYDVSKYYGNMLIEFEGYYMYIPETTNGKILLYEPIYSIHTLYYEIELQSKDSSTLESIKNMIKTKGKYESAFDRIIPETINGTQKYVDPYSKGERINQPVEEWECVKSWIKGGNNLYITLKPNAIKNDKYSPLDTSKIENNPTFLIEEHILSFTTTYVGRNDYPVLAYVTRDKKVKIIKIEDVIKTGQINSAEIRINGNVKKVEHGTDENHYIKIFAVLEDGSKIPLDL